MFNLENINEVYFDKLDSTQDYLLKNSLVFDSLTFVRTKEQTLGHGRMKRAWLSDENSLLFSFILKDKWYIERFESLSLLIGVSIFNSLKELGLKRVSIKWPNDVYVNDKKIAGIILESISYSEIDSIVIGVGLNVNNIEFHGLNATSIKQELKQELDIGYVKETVYKNIIDDLNKFHDDDKFYLKVINSNNYLLNKTVLVYPNGEKQEAIAKGINEDNSLDVIINDSHTSIKSDEVFLLNK